MAYQKHTWTDDEVITKEKLNNIEDGIANIELTPGPVGPQGATGPKGDKGDKGDSATVADATTSAKGIVKMATKVNAIATADITDAEATYTQATVQKIVTMSNETKEVVNAILKALKAAGIMSN